MAASTGDAASVHTGSTLSLLRSMSLSDLVCIMCSGAGTEETAALSVLR
jgi:hypothetical protein